MAVVVSSAFWKSLNCLDLSKTSRSTARGVASQRCRANAGGGDSYMCKRRATLAVQLRCAALMGDGALGIY